MVILILFFASENLKAQSESEDLLSFSCHDTLLEEVLEQLSKSIGLHIIYSPSMILTNDRFTLSVEKKTVDEFLEALGEKMNLKFKKRGEYVVVKVNSTPPVVPDTLEFPIPDVKEAEVFSEIDRVQAMAIRETEKKDLPNDLSWVPDFGRSLTKNTIHPSSSNHYSLPHSWFIAVGGILNDYSAGMEIQLGIKPLYLVFNPIKLRNEEFMRNGGLGTSIYLSEKFSFSPTYTYGIIRHDEWHSAMIQDTGLSSVFNGTSSYVLSSPRIFTNNPITSNTRFLTYAVNKKKQLHQLNLTVEYLVRDRIRLFAGPTFSLAMISVKTPTPTENAPRNITSPVIRRSFRGNSFGPELRRIPVRVYPENYQVMPSASNQDQSRLLWLGWKIGLLYKINFSSQR